MSDVTINPANVYPHSAAEIVHGFAAEPIVAGQAVTSAGESVFRLADCNDDQRSKLKGLALCSSALGQPVSVQKAGFVEVGEVLKPGQIYVLSATPGGVAPAEDVDAGWLVTTAGVAVSKSVLQLLVVPTGVRVPAEIDPTVAEAAAAETVAEVESPADEAEADSEGQ